MMTMAMTIHIVRIVLLMLGWKSMRPAAPGALSGAKSSTTCGAGNSSVPLMKQTGIGARLARAAPPLGNGGTRMNATMLRTMTAPMSGTNAADSPRPRLGGVRGLGATVVGRDLLARHACSTHRSAARRRARILPDRS